MLGSLSIIINPIAGNRLLFQEAGNVMEENREKAGDLFLGIIGVGMIVACSVWIICMTGFFSGVGYRNSGYAGVQMCLPRQVQVNVQPIRYGSLNGYHIAPDEKQTQNVILSLGGENWQEDYDQALEFGKQGHEVVVLLDEMWGNHSARAGIPLFARFQEFIAYADYCGIGLQSLTVVGGSARDRIWLGIAMALYP